jgi:hypothetical protein
MRRLSFSLRDVFWLTLVVACLIAWRVDHEKLLAENVKVAMMQSVVPVQFLNTPLEDVAQYMSDVHQIPVKLDIENLKKVGINAQTPVTFHGGGESLERTLQVCVGDKGKIVATKNAIVITIADEPPPRTSASGPAGQP